jgi:CBS domain-containing protein
VAGEAPQDIDEAVDRLYALPPDQFIASRDAAAAAAKAAGETKLAADIKRLRKPTVSAWAVNLLSRRAGDTLKALIELGPRLGKAQRLGRRDELRSLGEARHGYVTALVAAAGAALAEHGQTMSSAIALDVESTLAGALAEPDVAEAVLSGRLDRPVHYAGLGPVPALRLVPADEAEEAASLTPGTEKARETKEAASGHEPGGIPARGRTAGPDLEELAAEVDLAAGRHDEALADAGRVDEERARLRREYDDLRARLQELEGEIRTADRAANQTRRDVNRAERDLERAKRVLDRARSNRTR